MKKLLFLTCMSGLLALGSTAQKIGYIDADAIISEMPEAQKADSELKELQAELEKIRQGKILDFNKKDSIFAVDSTKWSATMKEIKRKELVDLYTTLSNSQNENQEFLQKEMEKKIVPIQQKVRDAINAVAKQNGYAYVLSAAAILVAPPGDDLMPLLRKQLGLKATSATTGTGTGK